MPSRARLPCSILKPGERTAVFRPHAMGEVFRPDWRKFKPGKTVSATAADYLAFNCIATMDDDS